LSRTNNRVWNTGRRKKKTPRDIIEILILGLLFAYLMVTTIHQLGSRTKSVLNQRESVHTTDRIKRPDITNPLLLLCETEKSQHPYRFLHLHRIEITSWNSCGDSSSQGSGGFLDTGHV